MSNGKSSAFQKCKLRLWLIPTEGKGIQQQRGKKPSDSVVYLKELSKPYIMGYLRVFLRRTVAAPPAKL